MKLTHINIQKSLANIEWVMLSGARSSNRGMPQDKVSIAFLNGSPKDPFLINKVKIRIGLEVAALLDWQMGDKIAVMLDKDNAMNFLLAKSENGNGYTLGKDAAIGFLLSFTWNHPVTKLKKRPFTVVEHHIHNDKLIIFEIDQNLFQV